MRVCLFVCVCVCVCVEFVFADLLGNVAVVMILLSSYCLYIFFCFIMTLNILIGLVFSISCR